MQTDRLPEWFLVLHFAAQKLTIFLENFYFYWVKRKNLRISHIKTWKMLYVWKLILSTPATVCFFRKVVGVSKIIISPIWNPSARIGDIAGTECPKMFRKYVLHLLKCTTNLHLSRCSTDLQKILGYSVYILSQELDYTECLKVYRQICTASA